MYQEQEEYEDIAVANVIIIVFMTLLIVLLFFAGLYFYYMRGGREYMGGFAEKHGLRMPSVPKPPTAATKLMPKNLHWPSFASMTDKENGFVLNNRLGRLLVRGEAKEASMGNRIKPTATVTPNPKSYGKPPAPQPPPRTKRSAGELTIKGNENVTRLATVTPRGGSGSSSSRQHVTPPAVPSSNLEIGAPTSVTINGVSVNDVQSGMMVVPAHPALASQPESSLEHHSMPQPPPLPKCPPPDEFDDVNLTSVA